MLLTLHDANLNKVAFIDNDKSGTLNYFDDTWTRDLETGSSTFEFSIYKKSLKSDTAYKKAYNYLNERAFVSFVYKGQTYLFNVMTVEEDETTIQCYCENLNLELINEYANPYKAEKAMSFVEYCNAMDLLNMAKLTVGRNEISDYRRTLEWEGQDTKLARLLSLANKFDAEIDFETILNDDSTLKSFKVNIYHENDDTHQGVGRVRSDIRLTYGKNLKSITRKVDKTGIFNMIVPTSSSTVETVDEYITIAGLPDWEIKNDDGIVEFYKKGEALYAPISARLYPSTFTTSTQSDQWIRHDMSFDVDSDTKLETEGLKQLKANAYPALTYTIKGYIDADIGDTLSMSDSGFVPILLLTARVSNQKLSFSQPSKNETTLANFKALESGLTDDIQSRLEKLIESSRPYTIRVASTNGTTFKNNVGESTITATLLKGDKTVSADVSWRWALDGNVTVGMQYLARAENIGNTAVLTVSAYIGNNEVATTEITLTNVNDGADGKTPYIHFAYADDDKGTNFSLTDKNQQYQGYYSDYTEADSTDYKKYTWVDRLANVQIDQLNLIGAFNLTPQNATFDKTDYTLTSTTTTNTKDNVVMLQFFDANNKETEFRVADKIGKFAYPFKITKSYVKFSIKLNSNVSDAMLWCYDKDLLKLDTDYVISGEVLSLSSDGRGNGGQIKYLKIQKGKLATGFSKAPQDVDSDINSKADSALTQEQLNALEAKRLQMEAELKAKATLEQVSELEIFVNNLKKEDLDGRQKIIEITKAIEERVKDIEPIMEYSQKLKFMDTYITQGNGGMIIGANDSTTKVVVTPDRISFQSGGSEVAYISQSMLHIDNGVFTMSLQLGHYITRAHLKNEYVNATYFVK